MESCDQTIGYATIRPVFAAVEDAAWAVVFQPGTPIHLIGGIPLLRVADRRYRLQHQYYPAITCDIPPDAITATHAPHVYRGAIADPRCLRHGVRPPRRQRACPCLGCWAIWWQERARAAGVTYETRGAPAWVRTAEGAVP